jgi:cytoskeleton-associated protein 5
MDGAPPQDDNIDALPLEQRLSHKASRRGLIPSGELQLTELAPTRPQVWKARLSAYTEVASLASKTVDDSDPLFRQHYTSGQSLRDWVRDANAVAQEKGVEAACAVVEFGGKPAAR